MSKKRYGDRRLETMSRNDLLDYAKHITREHGRAQASINRLIGKLRQWEAGRPPVPFARPSAQAVRHRQIAYRSTRD